MPKRKTKKVAAQKRSKLHVPRYVKMSVILLALLVVGLIARSLIMHENYKVLGASTLLARGGDDSGSDDSGGSSDSGSSSSDSDDSDDSDDNGGSSGSDSSASENSRDSSSRGSSSGSSSSNGGSANSNISENIKVLCTGPDGKKFETKRKDCEELSKAWNKPANFIVAQKQVKSQPVKTVTRTRSLVPSSSPSISDEPEIEDADEDVDSGIRTRIETNEDEERTEVRLSETERIRTRTKDGRTRIDITSGGIKTRLEIRDDRVVIKAEQEDGTEVELEDDALFKIDDRLAKDSIKIATAGAERFLLQKGAAGAVTDFPVSVDLATNTVFVNTPTGQKTITVLPEQAIQNLIAANVVNRLGGRKILDEATDNNLTSVSQLITLGERNGVPVYEINGISDQKLLGFIPILIEKDVSVSAETGNAVFIDQPFSSKILDAISL